MLRGSWVSLAVAAAPVELARSDGQSGSYSEPEVGFWKIRLDLPQARFWITSGSPTNHPQPSLLWDVSGTFHNCYSTTAVGKRLPFAYPSGTMPTSKVRWHIAIGLILGCTTAAWAQSPFTLEQVLSSPLPVGARSARRRRRAGRKRRATLRSRSGRSRRRVVGGSRRHREPDGRR
jgi:hypothetical protein